MPETRSPSANPESFFSSTEKLSSSKRAEQTSVGRVINGWEIVAKLKKSKAGKLDHPVYRGLCTVCGKMKDQPLSYFRIAKSCGCARYKRPSRPPCPEAHRTHSQHPAKPRRKQGARKPGVLIKHADMPATQQIMLSECLGPMWNALQNIAGDRFLMMLDAFQGDDVQIPTIEQIEKRIIMVKIASEFKRLKAERGYADRYIEPILADMAKAHKTSPKTIREILRLASIELRNAHSEYAFTMY